MFFIFQISQQTYHVFIDVISNKVQDYVYILLAIRKQWRLWIKQMSSNIFILYIQIKTFKEKNL